eukprot:TRINITY_DN2601_c0_g1_i7.p1 TRINITY_DN2601_c0_g1~~TRINITY_DN2601_c0_g1_i7.p1  ORF type:complete len:228 (+),score=32.90 TRINITY_DN2601_c0_g1_i7:559-1242(+)
MSTGVLRIEAGSSRTGTSPKFVRDRSGNLIAMTYKKGSMVSRSSLQVPLSSQFISTSPYSTPPLTRSLPSSSKYSKTVPAEKLSQSLTESSFQRTLPPPLKCTIKRSKIVKPKNAPNRSKPFPTTYNTSHVTVPLNEHGKPVIPYQKDKHRLLLQSINDLSSGYVKKSVTASTLNLSEPPLHQRSPKHHFKTQYSSTFKKYTMPGMVYSNPQVHAYRTAFIKARQKN